MTTPRRPPTVLVVDDESAVRQWAASALRLDGYCVYEAASPAEAMEIFSGIEAGLDILLTDIRMPEMDGQALAEWVRKRTARVRVIFMTGFSEQTVEAGAVVLLKPFTVTVLRQALARARA